ncbi:MAG: pyruvate formate lyase family protein [Armatimonadota bacterium]
MHLLDNSRVAALRAQAVAVKRDLDLERAGLLTAGYEPHLDAPVIIRRCEGLGNYLRNATPRILEGELVVGYQSVTSDWRVISYPEFWGGKHPETGDAAADARLGEIGELWSAHPEFRARGNLLGHCVPGYKRILDEGFLAIAERAVELASESGRAGDSPAASDLPVAYTPNDFHRAAAILATACAQYGRNYSAQARRMAKAETDPQRRAELEAIAEVCLQIPARCARTFHEALQALWFCLLFVETEDPPNAHSFGHLDQLLGPYYEADFAAGRLTREAAKELLACFWLKAYKAYDVQNGMIGGLNSDGNDVTNEVSYLVLEVMDELNLTRQTSVRWHRHTPRQFLEKACEVVSHGLDQPQFFNDEAIGSALVKQGIPLGDARNYGIIGCIEVTIPGLMDPRAVAYYCNLPKCLELALNDGVDMLTGQQVGPATGEASAFTYDDLWAAYQTQVVYDLQQAANRLLATEQAQAEYFPMPLLSLLTDDCLTRGRDVTAGGARYNATSVCAMGIPNVADALTAIRQLVFEEQALAMPELIETLRTDFAGREDLRQMLLHRAPKYGNNLETVDAVADEVAAQFCDALADLPHPRGGKFYAHLFTFTVAISAGEACAASADGRRAHENLANSLMPHAGRGVAGPAAALLSAARIDQTRAGAGTSLISELHPSALPPGHEAELLADLVSTYFQQGGMHLEFNIVGTEQLEAAQREPEKWAHLAVRVSGYSAYFTTLGRNIQDHIIARSAGIETVTTDA